LSRFFAFAVSLAGGVALAAAAIVACTADEPDVTMSPPSADSGANIKRDSAPVDPIDSGPLLDAGLAPAPSCEKYCDFVTENCTGENAQYASKSDCADFCGHLPLTEASRGGGEDKSGASVACRQYWADAPAKTDPNAYCLSAGPFGGNACGNRCAAFCAVVLSVCSPDGGTNAPYADQPSCADACAAFTYRDAGTDGGGEGPNGPAHGNSLNCRLYQLRAALQDPAKCPDLRVDSQACSD
jgi:hypothetical protein